MLNIRDLLPRKTTAPAPDEAELLGTVQPDPGALRAELDAVEAQLAADDREWERLDAQPANPRALLQQVAIAERRPGLQKQISALQPRIASAQARRSAFLELVGLLADIDEAIAAQAATVYERWLVLEPSERRQQLRALDGQHRVRARVAAALASVSTARQFRRTPDDPLATLRRDLLDRVTELDKLRAPGGDRPPVVWPPRARHLVDTLTQAKGDHV